MAELRTCLWFDDNAEEVVAFYQSVFPEVTVQSTVRYGSVGQEIHGGKEGSVMTIAFRMHGQDFLALNGGPVFKHIEAVSFVISCDTQAEIDNLWQKLSAYPEAEQCGWLKDKFGLSWQIVPAVLADMMQDPARHRVDKVMSALLGMKKLDIAALQAAYDS